MQVREARTADLDGVIHVGVTTWRATYPPITGEAYVEEGIAKWWAPEAVLPGIENGWVLVAEDDGVVGMAAYTPFEDHLMLWKLYVLPAAQGSGVGARCWPRSSPAPATCPYASLIWSATTGPTPSMSASGSSRPARSPAPPTAVPRRL
jgi:GNAT superfamily N-acetyltransferase